MASGVESQVLPVTFSSAAAIRSASSALSVCRWPATDRLVMRVLLGRKAGDFDPTRHDIVVRVSDDDDILAVTIPARALAPAGLLRL